MKIERIGLATLYLADCRDVLPVGKADLIQFVNDLCAELDEESGE